jgi:O-acetyl-ADP-ribose deacetylase (regulator of RNase III)
MVNYIDGDLIKLAQSGVFDVIAHGCNCKSTMGAGIAPQMAKAFGCDKFWMERLGITITKLGNIDYQHVIIGEKELTVVNAYTQFNYGRNHADGDAIPFSYEAFTLCMKKMNNIFKGKHIGLPYIGTGLAGANEEMVVSIIEKELKDCEVTLVRYKI